MGKSYDLKFDFNYLDCDNIKESECHILGNLLERSRVGNHLSNRTYCEVSFKVDDKKHQNPHVEELEYYTRNHVSGLMYDVVPNKFNEGAYNKLFIYSNALKDDGFYGFILFNTETPENRVHVYNIERDNAVLAIRINNILTRVSQSNKIKEELKKYAELDTLKEQNNVKQYY